MDGFPQTAKAAFTQAGIMADDIGLSLVEFCVQAKQTPSTVYRWNGQTKSYSNVIYGHLVKAHARLKKEKKKAKLSGKK